MNIISHRGYLDGRGDSNENGIAALTAAIGQGFEDVIQYGVDGICTDYPLRLRDFAG